MKNYIIQLEDATIQNTNFRKVMYTTSNLQLVLMSLKPGEEIGEETHDLDQFIRFEGGSGQVILNGEVYPVADGFAVIIPQGSKHNVINTSQTTPLQLYSIYTPPEHKDGLVQATKQDPETHFDGQVTAG